MASDKTPISLYLSSKEMRSVPETEFVQSTRILLENCDNKSPFIRENDAGRRLADWQMSWDSASVQPKSVYLLSLSFITSYTSCSFLGL